MMRCCELVNGVNKLSSIKFEELASSATISFLSTKLKVYPCKYFTANMIKNFNVQ